METIRTIAIGIAGLLTIASVLTALWFLFEAACRRHGWWPQLFTPTSEGGSREG